MLVHNVSYSLEELPYTTLGIEKGLSNNSVRAIFKDSNGFMWFGTHDGLNRYDGYDFLIFRSILGDQSSLPHNYIYSINEDKDQNIWVGTGQGVGIYNPLSNKFSALQGIRWNDPKPFILKAQIQKILADNRGDMYIGTNGSGFYVKRSDRKYAEQILLEKDGAKIPHFSVSDILVTPKNEIYLLIEGFGLFAFNRATKTIQLVVHLPSFLSCMALDHKNGIIISTRNGLRRLNLNSGKLEMLSIIDNAKLSADIVISMHIDSSHQLWLGTKSSGLKITRLMQDKKYWKPIDGFIENQLIFTIYEDPTGRKWVGSSKEGIIIFDNRSRGFKSISATPHLETGLASNYVSSFYEDRNHKIWIGTDGGGVSIWDRKRNSFENLKENPNNSTSSSNNFISCIKSDFLGDIWIATYGGGITRIIKDTKRSKRYKCLNPFTGFENDNIWQLLETHDKTFWATTFSHGRLYYFDRQEDRFKVFDEELKENLLSLAEDRSHTLWAGNVSQLIKMNRDKKIYEYNEIGKPVRAITEDLFGNFWIGTEGGGLILFDRKRRKIIKQFSTANGLCNNSILAIVEDKGALWLTTFSGLSRFDIKTQKFLNFYQEDGLQSNQFLDNSALKLSSGEVILGGLKGFSIFNPDSLRPRSALVPVVITGIRINNEQVSSDDNGIVGGVKNGNITKIIVPFGESLSVDFAALEYSLPGKIVYAYYLEGWDRTWNDSKNVRTANYTKLTQGNYRLRIRASNSDGVWQKEEKILSIKILPPWYFTVWAFTFYVILILAAGYLFICYYKRQSFLKYQVEIANANVHREKEIIENKLSFLPIYPMNSERP
ncbi:ligand-binding sensor domain-containing protein [Pedobacter sp. P26]|uniref:ligand-binding sensor domain-containing protein n=1 Tax=Pedobacter sp. P26 TaxID=3423956 RepID=UPI003D66D134